MHAVCIYVLDCLLACVDCMHARRWSCTQRSGDIYLRGVRTSRGYIPLVWACLWLSGKMSPSWLVLKLARTRFFHTRTCTYFTRTCTYVRTYSWNSRHRLSQHTNYNNSILDIPYRSSIAECYTVLCVISIVTCMTAHDRLYVNLKCCQNVSIHVEN